MAGRLTCGCGLAGRLTENRDVRRGGRRCLCGACEPVSQHGAEGRHENRGLLPRARASDFEICLGPPRVERVDRFDNDGRKSIMEIIHSRCAGMDVSKRDAKVCVRVAGQGRRKTVETVRTWGSTTNAVLALREHLIAERVSLVVMEATGDYWKPFYYLLEDADFEVMLVNARHVKNIPGRKSDVSDAAWLAQLGAHGLLRASFIPPEPVRHLRDLTRARSTAARDRARIVQRLEKFLESSGIKLSAVATDLTGVSARAMLEALVAGERDPKVLADLAKRTLRHKIPALIEALQGRFTEHHAFMVSQYLAQLDTQQATIDALTARIETVIAPFAQARDLLVTIPGISQT